MNSDRQDRKSGPSVFFRYFSRLVELLGSLTAPTQLIPIRVRTTRRQVGRFLFVLAALVMLAPGAVWADGKPTLPGSVPDLFNPEVRAHYRPIQVGNLRANPDLPLLMLVEKNRENPEAVLVGLDARNGKDTWSLGTDPIVLIAVFADASTITELHLDAGFVKQGTPSGNFQSVFDPRLETLPDLLRPFSNVPARTYM